MFLDHTQRRSTVGRTPGRVISSSQRPLPLQHSVLYQGYLSLSTDSPECMTFSCCRHLTDSVLFQARQGQRTSTEWFTATINGWNWKRSSITVGTSQSEGRQSWQQIWGSLRGR